MTGQELVDRCEARFGDTTNIVYSAVEWLAYVNAAYRAFLRQSKWPNLIAETTVAIAANGSSVALPAAALQGGVTAVLVNGVPLERQPADLPMTTIRHLQDRPTSPVFWDTRGGRVTVLPSWAAGGNLTLAYLAAPTAITLVTSPVIPSTYDDTLVAGALAQAYRDDGNADAAKQYQEEFDRSAASALADSGTDNQ